MHLANSLANSETTYGGVAKLLHWLMAALILTLLPLGFIAKNLAEATQAGRPRVEIDTLTTLFSLHKTLGVLVFLLALLRIIWALSQPKPKLLHGDRRLEAFAAETVHWLLYGALVAVPLSGWIHHAASTGFAPIWGPIGQSLPFVPVSETVAALFAKLHFLSVLLLIAALGLHIAGALKHHLLDRDATLRRMLPGRSNVQPSLQQPSHHLSLITALLLLGGLGTGAILLAPTQPAATIAAVAPASVQTAEPRSDTAGLHGWQLQQGSLTLQIRQLGNLVAGEFTNWTADIDYDPNTSDAVKGAILVEIDITSLQLGSVGAQAMGPDYFDSQRYATASYRAELVETDGQLTANGNLQIKDKSLPLSFPVSLQLSEAGAQAAGSFRLDRREFDLGLTVPDENTLRFGVDLSFSLTATPL